MALLQWYPLNGNITNKGSSNISATASGTISYNNNGKIGKCLSNGGLTLSAEGTAEVFNNSEVSIAFWIKPLNTTSGIIFGNDSTGESNNRKFSLYQYPTGNDLHWSWMNDTAGQTFLAGGDSILTGVLPTNVWTHVCVTYSNPTGLIYINGELKATRSGVSTSSTFAYSTSILKASSNRYINDLRIYDHALSQEEIRNLSKGLILQYDSGINSNLAVNSQTNYTYSGFNDSGNSITGAISWVANAGTYNGMTVCKWAPGKNGYNWVGPWFNTNAKFGATFVVGETYTISAYVRSDTPVTFSSSGMGEGQTITGGYYTVGTTWTRVWTTFVATKANHNCCFYAGVTTTTPTGYFYMCGVKVENGSAPTEWTNNSSLSKIQDTSLKGNEGTNYSSKLTSDKKLSLLAIDTQSTGYVKLPQLYFDNAFTICGWVKFTNHVGWARVFDFGTATEGSGYAIGLATSDANGTIAVFGRCGSGTALPDTAVTSAALNTWYHFAITISGTSLKVYWNGVLINSWTTTSAIGGQLYTLNYIGKSNWSADGYSRKQINDFRIYNTELSSTDISDMYNTRAKIDNKGNLYCCKLTNNRYTGALVSFTGVSEISDYNEEYEELEYIEATGSQYIKTGVIGPAIWEYDIQYTNTTKRQLMGHGGNGSEYWGTTDGFYGMSTWSKGSIAVGNRDIFRVENLSSGRKIYIDGVYSHTEGYDTRCESNEAQLFTIAGLSDYCNNCKLWSCKVWQNNILIRDFVPAKRRSDRVIGLLDKIGGKFYISSGSGKFLGRGSAELKTYGGYTKLEYIQSSGTQWIDTGIKVDLDNDKFELHFQANDASGNYFVAGSGWQENGKIWVYNYPSGSRFSCYATDTGGSQREFYGYSGPDAYFHNIIYDKRTLICDGVTTANNKSYTFGTTPYNFSLFNAVNSSGYFAKTKISRFKLWKSGYIVRDMIPVKRTSDGAIGMFDRISQKFFGNSGSGTFVAGPTQGEYTMLIANNIYEGMGASVSPSNLATIKGYKLTLSIGYKATATITRTASPLAGASLTTLSNGAVIYKGDVLQVSYSVSSSNYEVYSAKFNTTNITSSGQSFTVAEDTTISILTENVPRWHTIFQGNYYQPFDQFGTASNMLRMPKDSNGNLVEFVDLTYPVRVDISIDWDYNEVGNTDSTDRYQGEFWYVSSSDYQYVTFESRYWNATLQLQRPRRIGEGGVYKPFIACYRTYDSINVGAGAVTFHKIEQYYAKDD